MIEQTLEGAKIVFSMVALAVIFWVSIFNIDHSTKWIRVTAGIVLALFLMSLLLAMSYGFGIMME